MNRPLLRVLLMLETALLLASPAYALQQDRKRPLQINAASVNMNQKTGVTTYRGNVVLVQGSMRIEADLVEVRTRDMQIDTVTATGKPVRLRALLQDKEDEMKASARRLVLYAETREVDLSGDVQLRQGGDQFNAEHLHYALDEKNLSANGANNEDGRIYAIIQPSQKKKTP